MSESIIAHNVNGLSIGLRQSDGYVNATRLSKAYEQQVGKRRDVHKWLTSKRTEEMLTHLSSVTQIGVTELYQVIQGGVPENQGTWIHPKLATRFAIWLSDDFGLMVENWVEQWMTQKNQPTTVTRSLPEPELLDSKAISIYKESIEYFADNGDLEIASLLKCHFGNQLLQSKQKTLKPINLPEYEGVIDVAMRLGFNVPKNYESALGNHIARQYGHKRIGHNKRYSQSSEKQVCANMYPAYDPEIEKAVSSYCVAKAFYHRDIQMLG